MQLAQRLQCNVYLNRIFPFLRWLHLVNRETLKSDFFAGLTGAVIVLPQGVAFALIAGLPPVYGLYTAMVPPIFAALFGSSRHLISGPTTALSIVVFATVSKVAAPGSSDFISLALTLTFLAGVYQLALGIARLGTLINFISHSVVVGFTAGAAVLIASSQLKHYFGVAIPSGESFINTLITLVAHLGDTNPYVFTIASLTLATAIIFQIYKPRWPGLLFAMIVGSLAGLFINSEAHGVKLVGEIPAHLPPFSVPDLSLGTIKILGSGAFAIAMLGLVEAVSIARSIANRSGQRIDGSQEFIGQGVANIVGSFFSSYASSGSFTRSGLNYTAGAVTPLSAVFAAVSLMIVVLLVAPLASHLPIAAMAGILLMVAYRLVDFHHIAVIVKSSRAETAVLIVTFLATLFVELEFAIYVGVMMSLVMYLNRASKPRIISRLPDPSTPLRRWVPASLPEECPQLKIIRIDGSLFFGAVDYVRQAFHQFEVQDPEQKHLLIIGSGINFIDVAGAELLAQEARSRRARGGGLYLAKVKDDVCATLKRGGFVHDIREENIFATKGEAIAAIYKRLQAERCAKCDKRLFEECGTPNVAPSDDAAVAGA